MEWRNARPDAQLCVNLKELTNNVNKNQIVFVCVLGADSQTHTHAEELMRDGHFARFESIRNMVKYFRSFHLNLIFDFDENDITFTNTESKY